MNFPIVSIIIPVLNEAAGIVQQLARLQDFRAQGAEIIVVDGGSSDGSAERASALTDGVAMSLPGRGRQMNIGAARPPATYSCFFTPTRVCRPPH